MTVIAASDVDFGIIGTTDEGCRAARNELLTIAELDRQETFVAPGVVVGGRSVAPIATEESWTSYFGTGSRAILGRRSVALGLATTATASAGELVVV